MITLFYVIASILILVVMVALFNSTAKGRHNLDRLTDLLVGAIAFMLFTLLVKIFGGYL